MVEKGRLKKERGGGYAQAVISRMFEQWPEMVGLLCSDISNKKAELFKGAFGGMAGGVEGWALGACVSSAKPHTCC